MAVKKKAKRAKKAKRTAKGNVTAVARARSGIVKGEGRAGRRFPIFDRKSAMSALRLRGHARGAGERSRIISRAAKYAPAAAKKARAADKKKK